MDRDASSILHQTSTTKTQSFDMLTPRRISTRILILSDTHSALPDRVKYPYFRFCQDFPEADVAIHCGDLTSSAKGEEHKRALTLLKSLPAPIKIVIPGNHDMTLDSTYLQRNQHLHGWRRDHTPDDFQEAIATYTSQEAKDAGIRYLVEGLSSFNLPNGAKLTVYASAFTPEFYNWAFAYPRSEDRYNVTGERMPDNPVPVFRPRNANEKSRDDQVTVMVTHGPPRGILDRTLRGDNAGCDHLLAAVSRCRPLLHCFGHIHEAWGADWRTWPGKVENMSDTSSYAADSEAGKQRSEQPPIVVSHPSRPVDTAGEDSDKENTAVSVIDATTLEHGKHTVFVNASIMDIRYAPRQWPWLVQLELPEASEEEMETA